MLISILGLIVMAAGTACGCSLLGWSSPLSVILGVCVLIGGFILLFYAVKGKTCTTDFGKWLSVEIASMAVLFVILGFAVLPTSITINFIFQRGELSAAADEDIVGIDSLIATFDRTETARLDGTFRGLENYLRLGNRNCSPALGAYISNTLGSNPQHFSQNIINNNRGTMQARIEDLRLGNRMFRNSFNRGIERLHENGNSRIPLRYGELGEQLDTLSGQVGRVLTDISASMELPMVYAGTGNQYTIRSNEPTVYRYQPHYYKAEFAKVCKPHWRSVVLAVFAAVIALFYYLISYRALRKGIDKGKKISDTLGFPL